DERAGVKFKDADLLGIPMQLVLGRKSLAKGLVEGLDRRTRAKVELPLEHFEEAFLNWQGEVNAAWASAAKG
ncbi:MAG: proline--tRNA ligase, partial [Desulfovibrio sp.]|nr:proline--tRNA ligase [Desulfovibrio sp.]